MMKHNIKKITVFLLCIIVISTFSTVLVGANEDFIEWEISPDQTTITGDGREYRYYPSAFNVDILSEEIISYENPLDDDYYGYFIFGSPSNIEVIWLDDGRIFATPKGIDELDSFISGNYYSYMLSFDEKYANIDGELVSDLKDRYTTSENAKYVSVSKLINSTRYDIIARDRSHTFAYTLGAIYLFENELYFVDYTALDNSYFDSNGNFSYRKGEVALVPVGEENIPHINNAVKSGQYFSVMYIYENEEVFDFSIPDSVFWIIYIILMFILPIPLLILGIVFANRSSWKRPKYWYILSLIAIIWIVLSIILTVLILL